MHSCSWRVKRDMDTNLTLNKKIKWSGFLFFIFLVTLWPGIGLGQGLTCGICAKIIEG